jgi:hypothetical protein
MFDFSLGFENNHYSFNSPRLKMKFTTLKLFALALVIPFGFIQPSDATNSSGLTIIFQEEAHSWTAKQKRLINRIIKKSEKEVRQLLPGLPENITVEVHIIDRDIDVVGGITGRTESNVPPLVIIEISKVFPGGITAAVDAALRPTLFHEFHHLSRGWAIKDNKYGPGISTAAVNEGLAVVFSEEYTQIKFEANAYPEEADSWVKEILPLPKDADYHKWMFEHPDGRTSVGYRTGHFIIRQAMATSGKDVLELSKKEPEEILRLAGY